MKTKEKQLTNLEEAETTARRFIMDKKYKIYLPGPSNRSRRENWRQCRERLLAGGGLTVSAVVKVMLILDYEVFFKKEF